MLPIHTLKLDRAFVRDIETDENDAAISAATLALARNLGLRVVAEGVETEAQRDFLSSHACNLLQGYRSANLSLQTYCRRTGRAACRCHARDKLAHHQQGLPALHPFRIQSEITPDTSSERVLRAIEVGRARHSSSHTGRHRLQQQFGILCILCVSCHMQGRQPSLSRALTSAPLPAMP